MSIETWRADAEKIWREDFNPEHYEHYEYREREMKPLFIAKYCADKAYANSFENSEIWKERCIASKAWYDACAEYEIKYQGRRRVKR